ncbi:hemagglutinin repeat-containing protein [Pseudomonas sp. Irchel 3A5]|uniref:hemagglutinin repeat-containing protein n=1 Tax=Pseudomonas sp. Irchel 3A5 TaxID=2008911 RepID=UPI002114D62C|nr:hemagglutinin repeat-containing protein [Pseudomonas sp. Irchel 3A5]
MSGSNVTISAGTETARQTTEDSSKSLAVGRVVGGSVVDTARSMRDASKAAQDADDPRLKAVKIAQAAMAAYNLGGQAMEANGQSTGFKDKQGGTASNGSLIKIGTELANTRSKSSSEYNAETARQSTLKTGGDLLIVATGQAADTQGDIRITGSSLEAANTFLLAKNDVVLQSAQNTMDRKNDGSSNKTAIGASFNIGEQNGFTLDLGAQAAKNMGDGNSITQVNTTLDTGSLVLQSGRDTTLAGAQVRADAITATIGRDLNILSRQDIESSSSKQSSGGFGASICVPPFCYGSTVAGSANIAAGNMNSDYQAVTDQSGLFAGKGGYDINVGKTTTLQGAVIASEASADKNRLSTDRLSVSDIKNTSDISVKSAALSISSSSAGGTSPGGSIPLALSEDASSDTRSAVSDGTIIVRNAEGANDLVGLNRDTANANQQLDRPDQKAIQERVDLVQSTAQLSSDVISAVAKAKAEDAKEQTRKAVTIEQIQAATLARAEAARWQVGGDKKLMADIATGLLAAGLGGVGGSTAVGIVAKTSSSDIFNKLGDFADAQRDKATGVAKAAWADGGAARIMLHALGGAAIGLSSGSAASGAAGAGASAALVPSISQAMLKSGMSEADTDTVSALIAAGVGTTVGSANGVSGAAVAGSTAVDVERFNRQLHKSQELPILKKKAGELEATVGETRSGALWQDLLLLASGAQIDAADQTRLKQILSKSSGSDPESRDFAEDMSVAYGVVTQLAAQKVPLTWSDGSPIIANGDVVYAFNSTDKQFKDASLFNSTRTNAYGSMSDFDLWMQFGKDQAQAHDAEILPLSTSTYNVGEAVDRLSAVAGKGILEVSAIDDAILSMTGLKGGKVAIDLALEIISKRQAAKAELLAAKEVAGAKGPAGGLPSGETKVVGDGTQAANDASFAGAKGPASDLPSGETKVVGNGTPAANDEGFTGANGPASDLPSGETKVVANGTPAANDASFEGAKVTEPAGTSPTSGGNIAANSNTSNVLTPGTVEHKAQRWADYQAINTGNDKAWSYDRWNGQYEVNMKNSSGPLQREAEYRLALGGENVVIKTPYGPRQIDAFVPDESLMVQIKTGKESLTTIESKLANKSNEMAIKKDAYLVKQGYQVEWVLEKGATKPLLNALEKAGVKYRIGPLIQ